MSVATASTAAPSRVRGTPRWPIPLAGGLVLVVAGATLARHGADTAGLELLNRQLARLGFLFFLPIYAASPLLVLAPSVVSRGLVRVRRSLGLAYALVMAAHLLAIVAWYAAPEIVLEPDLFVIGGGVGLAWIAALAATSNDASLRRLGRRRWRALHAPALHYLWIVYLVTYAGRVAEHGAAYGPGLVGVLALPLLRVAAWAKRRRARRE